MFDDRGQVNKLVMMLQAVRYLAVVVVLLVISLEERITYLT